MKPTSKVFVTGGSGFLGRTLIPALLADGFQVRALARSDGAASIVAELGAVAVAGDLSDEEALTTAMTGCDLVVHAAARMEQGGPAADYMPDNVAGIQTMLAAADNAGVHRFVSIGAAMCLLGGEPIVNADESWPLHQPRYCGYAATKTIADQAVRAANRPGFATCVIRPGWIWGPGDPQLDAIAAASRAGKMMLIDRGTHPLVTSHVDNVAHAITLALRHTDTDTDTDTDGQAYFIFDADTTTTGEFLSRLLATRGLPAPNRSIPYPLARTVASTSEAAWRWLRRTGPPPISRLLVELNGRPFLVSDRLARAELGYQPVTSRDQGITRLHLPQIPARHQATPPLSCPGEELTPADRLEASD
jgi:nucleoside-diphosphate-sugar epimerase